MEGLGARLEELQREQGRRVAVCPLPALELAQAREDQLAGAVAELEQELLAAKEVKEDAVQCVLAAWQGKEAAEERAREERARLQVIGLLYSCCIDYPQALLDLGHAHPGYPRSRLCNAHISTGTGSSNLFRVLSLYFESSGAASSDFRGSLPLEFTCVENIFS